jgi:hypothetical protein
MSLSQETLLELMSLADGELEGEARLRAEKLVAESDEARRVLEGFKAPHVGMWLSETLERRAAAGGADGIADLVMGKLAAESPPAAHALAAGSGVVSRIDARRSGSKGRVFVAAVCAVTALAAGVALFVRSGQRAGGDRMPVASVGMPSVDMQGPPPGPGGSGSGVEVDEVDSPSRGISVFEIPLRDLGAASASAGGHSPSSVVIWIDDEGAK